MFKGKRGMEENKLSEWVALWERTTPGVAFWENPRVQNGNMLGPGLSRMNREAFFNTHPSGLRLEAVSLILLVFLCFAISRTFGDGLCHPCLPLTGHLYIIMPRELVPSLPSGHAVG